MSHYTNPSEDYWCFQCGQYHVHSSPDLGSFFFGLIFGSVVTAMITTELGRRTAAAAMGIAREELERRIAALEARRR
jgi:hypothetical protein